MARRGIQPVVRMLAGGFQQTLAKSRRSRPGRTPGWRRDRFRQTDLVHQIGGQDRAMSSDRNPVDEP